MKKVRYEGEEEKILPTLGIKVNKGDEVDVPDDFANIHFILVGNKQIKKGDKN